MRIKAFSVILIIIESVVFAACTACSRGEASDSDGFSISFPSEEKVEWEIMESDAILPFPKAMAVRDSVIYVSGESDHSWVHLVDKRSGKSLGSFIGSGNGPGEISDASGMDICSDGVISLFDANRRLVNQYDAGLGYLNSISAGSLFSGMLNCHPLSDTIFLVRHARLDDGDAARVFSIADLSLSRELDSYVYDASQNGIEQESLIVESSQTIAPDGKHFASGTLAGGILELFEIKGNKIIPVAANNYCIPRIEKENGHVKGEDFPVIGFTSMTSTDDRLIASYCGSRDEKEATKIGIWDWHGNPLKKIETDAMILNVAYDAAVDSLYAVIVKDDSDFLLARMKMDLH